MKDGAVYRIERGGVERRVYGAKRAANRAASTLVAQTTNGLTAEGHSERHWVGDLRRGRLNIYGGLLRFIDLLHRRGVPMETALLIPAWITAYVRDIYLDTPAEDANAVELDRAA